MEKSEPAAAAAALVHAEDMEMEPIFTNHVVNL